jgi:hypothetical protein
MDSYTYSSQIIGTAKGVLNAVDEQVKNANPKQEETQNFRKVIELLRVEVKVYEILFNATIDGGTGTSPLVQLYSRQEC